MSLSGCCNRVAYLSFPNTEATVEAPVLDLSGSGVITRTSETTWSVTHEQVLRVKQFQTDCYERSADFDSVLLSIKIFNQSIKGAKD